MSNTTAIFLILSIAYVGLVMLSCMIDDKKNGGGKDEHKHKKL